MKKQQKQEKQTSEHRNWERSASAALSFSLSRYKDRLQKKDLVKLNTRPREIDVQIIDKQYGAERIDNAIGHLFERHNLIELKNPYEQLNIDVIWKGISYAAQYKSSGIDKQTGKKGVDAIPIDEVTLTFIRISKPINLFKDIKKRGYGIEQHYPGVYYITGIADIRMQIVVGKELEGDEFVALRVQGSGANEEDIKKFIKLAGLLKDSEEKDAYDAIMQTSMTENEEVYNNLKEGDGIMCEALERLM